MKESNCFETIMTLEKKLSIFKNGFKGTDSTFCIANFTLHLFDGRHSCLNKYIIALGINLVR